MNLSIVSNESTAKTNIKSAQQRAAQLAGLGVKNVLELCVGPSLETLESCYKTHNIRCTGNDIDKRWQNYYSRGNWIIGDCLDIDPTPFDCLVFAPPLSKGCSGQRKDALMIDDVKPSYLSFIKEYKGFQGRIVLVLPARSYATKQDRNQFHKLLFSLPSIPIISERTDGKIRKYVDLIF